MNELSNSTIDPQTNYSSITSGELRALKKNVKINPKDLPKTIYHGTLAEHVESVQAGPRNDMGAGSRILGGEGLYAAYDRSAAEEYAWSKNEIGKQPVIMEGKLKLGSNTRVARITLVRSELAADIPKGIFPANWSKDKVLKEFMHKNFDVIEIVQAEHANLNAPKRFLVLNESVGPKAIKWKPTVQYLKKTVPAPSPAAKTIIPHQNPTAHFVPAKELVKKLKWLKPIFHSLKEIFNKAGVPVEVVVSYNPNEEHAIAKAIKEGLINTTILGNVDKLLYGVVRSMPVVLIISIGANHAAAHPELCDPVFVANTLPTTEELEEQAGRKFSEVEREVKQEALDNLKQRRMDGAQVNHILSYLSLKTIKQALKFLFNKLPPGVQEAIRRGDEATNELISKVIDAPQDVVERGLAKAAGSLLPQNDLWDEAVRKSLNPEIQDPSVPQDSQTPGEKEAEEVSSKPETTTESNNSEDSFADSGLHGLGFMRARPPRNEVRWSETTIRARTGEQGEVYVGTCTPIRINNYPFTAGIDIQVDQNLIDAIKNIYKSQLCHSEDEVETILGTFSYDSHMMSHSLLNFGSHETYQVHIKDPSGATHNRYIKVDHPSELGPKIQKQIEKLVQKQFQADFQAFQDTFNLHLSQGSTGKAEELWTEFNKKYPGTLPDHVRQKLQLSIDTAKQIDAINTGLEMLKTQPLSATTDRICELSAKESQGLLQSLEVEELNALKSLFVQKMLEEKDPAKLAAEYTKISRIPQGTSITLQEYDRKSFPDKRAFKSKGKHYRQERCDQAEKASNLILEAYDHLMTAVRKNENIPQAIAEFQKVYQEQSQNCFGHKMQGDGHNTFEDWFKQNYPHIYCTAADPSNPSAKANDLILKIHATQSAEKKPFISPEEFKKIRLQVFSDSFGRYQKIIDKILPSEKEDKATDIDFKDLYVELLILLPLLKLMNLDELKEIFGQDFSEEKKSKFFLHLETLKSDYENFQGDSQGYCAYLQLLGNLKAIKNQKLYKAKNLELTLNLLSTLHNAMHAHAHTVLASPCTDKDVRKMCEETLRDNYILMANHPYVVNGIRFFNLLCSYGNSRGQRRSATHRVAQTITTIQTVHPKVIPQTVALGIGICYGETKYALQAFKKELLNPFNLSPQKNPLNRAQQFMALGNAVLFVGEGIVALFKNGRYAEYAKQIVRNLLEPCQDFKHLASQAMIMAKTSRQFHKYITTGASYLRWAQALPNVADLALAVFSLNNFLRAPLNLPKDRTQWGLSNIFWNTIKNRLPNWNGTLSENRICVAAQNLIPLASWSVLMCVTRRNPLTTTMWLYQVIDSVLSLWSGQPTDETLQHIMINLRYHKQVLQDLKKQNEKNVKKIASTKEKILSSCKNLRYYTSDSVAILPSDSLTRKCARIFAFEIDLKNKMKGKAQEECLELLKVDLKDKKFVKLNLDLFDGINLILRRYNILLSEQFEAAWISDEMLRECCEIQEYLFQKIDTQLDPEDGEDHAEFQHKQQQLKSALELLSIQLALKLMKHKMTTQD
jgi:hypothetical protein